MLAGDGKGTPWAEDPTVSVTSRRTGSAVLIEVEGELDLASAPHLHDCLVRAISHNDGAEIHLDLSAVSFLDAAGWRPVVEAAEALEGRGESLVIRAMSPQARLLVEVVGMDGGISMRTGHEIFLGPHSSA